MGGLGGGADANVRAIGSADRAELELRLGWLARLVHGAAGVKGGGRGRGVWRWFVLGGAHCLAEIA